MFTTFLSAVLMCVSLLIAQNWSTTKFDFLQKVGTADEEYNFPKICTDTSTVQPVPATVLSTNQRTNAVIVLMMKKAFEKAEIWIGCGIGLHIIAFLVSAFRMCFKGKNKGEYDDVITTLYDWFSIGLSIAATTICTVGALMVSYPFLTYYNPSDLIKDVVDACQTAYTTAGKENVSLIHIAFKHQTQTRRIFCVLGSQLLIGILAVLGFRHEEAKFEQKAKNDTSDDKETAVQFQNKLAPWAPVTHQYVAVRT